MKYRILEILDIAGAIAAFPFRVLATIPQLIEDLTETAIAAHIARRKLRARRPK